MRRIESRDETRSFRPEGRGCQIPFYRRAGGPYRSRFFDRAFLSRTPGPPPFSSRNSIPPFSSAIRSFSPVIGRPPKAPSAASNRLIVGMDTPDVAASFSWDHPSSARAALTWRIDTFGVDIRVGPDRYFWHQSYADPRERQMSPRLTSDVN